VGRLLKGWPAAPQAPAKQNEGTAHPDRNRKCRYLNDAASSFVADGQPVISVDTTKKERVGEFSNKCPEYQAAGRARMDEHPRLRRSPARPGHSLWRL
jgi:hypothetical protein